MTVIGQSAGPVTATEGIRARSSYRFAKVPEWMIFHTGLDDGDLRVYAALDRIGARKFPSIEVLGEKLGKSPSTTRRSIARLKAAGAIQVTEVFTDEGRQTSNEYLLAADVPLGGRVSDLTDRAVTDESHGAVKNDRAGVESKDEREKNPSGSSRGTALERQRDELYDALVRVCGIDYDEMTPRARKSCGVATAELRHVGATPAKIERAANAWAIKFPRATMTPHGIATQYAQLLATPVPANVVRFSKGGDAIRRAAARGQNQGENR